MKLFKSFPSQKRFESQTFRIPISFLIYSTVGYLIGLFIFYNNPFGGSALDYLDKRLIFVYIPAANFAGFVSNFILSKLTKILPWTPFMVARFSIGFLASFLLTVILFFLAEILINPLVSGKVISLEFTDIQIQLFLKLLVILAFILFIFNLIHLSLFSYRVFFINSLKLNKIKSEQIRLHIEALKNQLTPHYLFNNLNTISALLSRDKIQTEKYIRTFVNTCRFMIDNSRNILIPIKQELEFVKSYMFLMEIRFPQMLKFEVTIPESIYDMLIPPLSIQLLVENAIKHNSISSDDLLYIRISCSDNRYIIIESNTLNASFLQKANEKPNSSGKKTLSTNIGLNNLRTRFSYFSENPVLIEKTEVFSVKLPIIKYSGKIYAPEIA